MILFGLDRLLNEASLRKPLQNKRVALLAHPATVTNTLEHGLDAIAALDDINLTAAFGPQHGLKGDKQDNMVETADEHDPVYNIPVFSLYGEVRRPTDEMMDTFDVLLVDLQDLGCRIYTFVTTLLYVLEAAAKHNKTVWVLDRPNPAGRPVEGMTLKPGWESFVGAGPMPMRHGMTLGEMGKWFIDQNKLDVDYKVIEMSGWQPDAAPGYGWPLLERSWINPSPNAPTLNMARAYAGTVMLEGTTLSEGRGTTRALEVIGAPDINAREVLSLMEKMAPQWAEGCRLRECWFEPTFHKHEHLLCHGFQIHADEPSYQHDRFKPWRIIALALHAIRKLYPDYNIWRDFPYEYENDKLAFDVINGSELLRQWVDDPEAVASDLDAITTPDEEAWRDVQQKFAIY
ncbi:exo-beta-N-acetylmuramidase NamZ domain-containing protein [Hyphococcus sp. DH-69]|uniref:exo-beta-N-acetylmuramidase NamZ family protein n=1 Tax=Hyphococcus formosus TaxID=3143534 RepID=UPI00398B7820